ncbi:MAG: NapC/NirT family cytochrome c [Verrucomicrobiia bacterium]
MIPENNTSEINNPQQQRQSWISSFRNWLSLSGVAIMAGSLFAFILLFILDSIAHFSNPYVGVLSYLVCPSLWVIGAIVAVIGAIIEHRKMRKAGGEAEKLLIDLARKHDRKILFSFIGIILFFFLFIAIGSYHGYHFTESSAFCGQVCHQVMKPEMVTYQHSPHARVSCAECHIGPGASWFVKYKISGAYQVYATIANKYPRPVPTPIKNLRPAQETCERCHWPKKFVGNLDRTYNYYLSDETNTLFTIRMLMKVGGADPTHGPVGGIHWHMNVANKIEYIATDTNRLVIPWVRVTDPLGVVTEFRTKNFTNDISNYSIRTMDCMDCHNRPSHIYKSPNDAVNLAMSLGKIDPSIPWIKSNAVYMLVQDYKNETEAIQKIATTLSNIYTNNPKIRPVIAAVQDIYTNNFFPEMKANWKVYPNHIGHKDWPGCFRCHDGKHKTADGKQTIKANDCNACHIILAQGSGSELEKLNARGEEFKHPGGDYDISCTDCHTGGF